jgi:hypothetical protein
MYNGFKFFTVSTAKAGIRYGISACWTASLDVSLRWHDEYLKQLLMIRP